MPMLPFIKKIPPSALLSHKPLLVTEDLAVDWIANNLYWTETLSRTLEVFSIDTAYSTELLASGPHSAPRAIVVDPSTRCV